MILSSNLYFSILILLTSNAFFEISITYVFKILHSSNLFIFLSIEIGIQELPVQISIKIVFSGIYSKTCSTIISVSFLGIKTLESTKKSSP